ncbi:HesA/MoeB/ThiF family protein [Mesorhizobium sp. PL10]
MDALAFNYEEFTTRNIGFVSEAQQARLRDATVFVCGTGGMGGACIMALARIGVGRLIIADLDTFAISNLNRQVFAFMGTVGRLKAEATRDLCLTINPQMQIVVYGKDWPEHATSAIRDSAIVVNGTDDLGASLLLYRTARGLARTVVDAYASPLPSVYVTRPSDPMPEERLGYPTSGTAWDALTPEQRATAFLHEAEYVVLNSSSRHHVDLAMAGEVAAGKRSRMSFAPMVVTTGMLMAYEVTAGILGNAHGADCRGWFFNPYKGRVERPRNVLVAALLRPIVRRFMLKLMAADR